MLLEPIYEQDFYDCSYGFRPGRSTHQAIDATWRHTMDVKGGFVLEVDLRKFFDTFDHGHLRTFLQQRVRDGVILRLIGKWLNAGVMESGNVSYPDQGSPQGGCISPLLANAYLHYVMDEWFHREVSAPDARTSLLGSICGRRGDDLRVGIRRSSRDGGTWAAMLEVRPDDSP